MPVTRGITDFKFTNALDILGTAAAADRNGATLDMLGYEGVRMCVKFGTIAAGAVTSIKAQQGAQANMSDAADLAGTGITVEHDDDNQLFILELHQPAKRYVRVVVDKDGTNATQECAWYEQYGAQRRPVAVNVADAVTYERHMTPDEGTA